jgi:hypothetical protein
LNNETTFLRPAKADSLLAKPYHMALFDCSSLIALFFSSETKVRRAHRVGLRPQEQKGTKINLSF